MDKITGSTEGLHLDEKTHLPDVEQWFEVLISYTRLTGVNTTVADTWPGKPFSRDPSKNNMDDYYRLADNAIALSPPEMCLTSKYHYIRECKKWLIENGQDGVKMKDPYNDIDEEFL
jgi:hypothetical protein